MRTIAVEEAFTIPEVASGLRDVSRGPSRSLDKPLLRGVYDSPEGKGWNGFDFLKGLLDVDGPRLAEMDRLGVDMHVLSLSAPGVQMFDADTATELAALANDRLAEHCRRYPTRFAGLASVAPQSPKRAALEIERAIGKLGLNGLIINSHTNDEYLDDPKYFPILEAAEALGACIYIHPRGASSGLKGPFEDLGLEAAGWGYGVEVGTHIVRLLASGVFDRFPKLTVCIGHMGEAIPFWLWRFNYMNSRAQAAGRVPKTQLSMEEYVRRNLMFTTSGVEDPLALRYVIDRVGIDNVMWAIDYPYQPQAPALDFLRSAPLSEEERHKLAHANAERIFRIPALAEAAA